LVIGVAGCSHKNDSTNALKAVQFPKLIDFPNNGVVIDTNTQMESLQFPLIIAALDSLKYSGPNSPKTIQRRQKNIKVSKSNKFQLLVDSDQQFSSSYFYKTPLDFIYTQLDSNGNEIRRKPYIPPYDQVIKHPVFVINELDSAQVIEVHDGILVAIQEAQDEQGNWVGIEYFSFSGCGNSFWRHLVPPHHLMMFGVNKYQGNFKTKLRVRLQTNGTTLVSNKYSGYINKGQLEKPDFKFGWNSYLNEED
jgi:hypothetical protein